MYSALLNAWKALLSKSLFTDVFKAVGSYMLLDNSICQFLVLSTRSKNLSPLLQRSTVVDLGGPLNFEEDMDAAPFGRSANTGDALPYVTYLMFDRLSSLILKCDLYLEGKE